MKKILIGLLAFVVVFSLTGCGAREKLEKKAEEEFTEKILEEAGAGDVDVDGEKITIKGESGEEVTFGGGEWPTSELAKSIPIFENGIISAVVDSSDSVMVTLDSVQKEDVSTYMETIKKEFSQENYETKMDDLISLSGLNDVGIGVSIVYADEVMTITVFASQQE